MKIFILDKYKITKFNLPEKIEDSFLIPYKVKRKKQEHVVTIEGENGSWYLKSNGNVNVMNGTFASSKCQLPTDKYTNYDLKILGSDDPVVLFAMPSNDKEVYKLNVQGLTNISIGSAQKTNICYSHELMDEVHAEIKFLNNEWYITTSTNEKAKTYVNYSRVVTSKLSIGDVIFINGLKIVWMEKFIKINNPNRKVLVNGLGPYNETLEDNTKYSQVSDEDANVDLYDEDDYFYHMPRIVPQVEPVEFTIDAPPEADNKEDLPFLLTIGSSLTMGASSIMMAFSAYNSLQSGKSIWQALPQLIMCFAMIVGSLIMPRITTAYQKKKRKKREQERQTKYKAYLDKINTKIQQELKRQAQVLKESNLSTKECCSVVMNQSRNFWSRVITDEDFLNIRLGLGNIPSYVKVRAPEEHFTLDEDNLQEMVYEVDKNSKTLIDVPISLSLTEQSVLAFVFNCTYKDTYVDNLLLQLTALQSATELKIVLLTNEENQNRWDYVKYLPHTFSEDKSLRFFATNSEEVKEVSSYLMEEFQKRVEESESENGEKSKTTFTKHQPYYLIITDDYKTLKHTPILKEIEKNKNVNFGFSFLTISNSLKEISNKCEKFIEIGEKESCILEKKLKSQSQVIFKNECEKNIDMRLISIKLANVPLLAKDGVSVLPNSLSFLEMYGVSKIEQLNIVNRWQTNNPVNNLSTPIGVHIDGSQFKLDLHEKFHGPHGLIAGATGSGKSEFIMTYILSMAVNYHPYEVQFVLIDYKGGGLAGAFENKETGIRIPHLVGTITNLDTAEMNRTLVSISSELKRRQKKFNEVKDRLNESTIDIYKYQRFYREGLIDEPMAHLFIITDEFAELKSQQPEFLQELVSTARIGRSLGVHLILATQKPSGVVNDQIWSNSKFKVCLKVQDKSDSMEMLKRPEAASIKEVGRFYLQVGYNDYFDIGQSGWGGAKYVPTDKILKKHDDSINIINNVGTVLKSVNELVKKETTENLGEQLTNVVRYIYDVSKKENIKTKSLWLDKIPNELFINDLVKKYSYKATPYLINPIIGEYDNPAQQEQGLLNLNLNDGNTLIYGKSGSGKENLLSTILWSTCVNHTPKEVNMYVIDCGAESLKMFNKFPHIGGIATVDDSDKIIDILSLVDKEMEYRKDKYADYGGSYKNYCENSGSKDPLIVTIINNYEVFSETYGRIAEGIQTMYRDGAKYGVVFIVSCTTTNSIRMRTAQYFANKLSLQLPDKMEYRNLLNAPKNLVPADVFGRGIVSKKNTAYEFQTANITDLKKLNMIIKNAGEQLAKAYTTSAKRIKTIPKEVDYNSIVQSDVLLNELPIGYDINTKDIVKYDFTSNKFNMLIGNDISNRLNFVSALIKQVKKVKDINLKVIDLVDAFDTLENISIIKSNFDREFAIINNEIVNENPNVKNFYIIVGAGELRNKLSETGIKIVSNLFMASSNFKNSNFMFIDNYSSYKKLQLEPWYQTQVNNSSGIWLGPDVGSQMSINIASLSLEDRKNNYDYMGLVINNGNHKFIKYMIDLGDKNEK